MRWSRLALPIMGCLLFLGCGSRAGDNTPAVEIKLDKDKGLDVKAPGVNVKANKEDGIEMKAPGVDIEARPKDDEQ